MRGTEVVLVTGASTGIGRETVRTLANRGFRVFASARRDESVRELELEGRERGFEAIALDVESDASVDAAIEHVTREAGGIDVLVNNAGFGLLAPVEAITPEDLRAQFETNVIGAHRVVRAVLPSMRARQRGTIVQISSVMGRVSMPLYGAYSASKFALEALSDALRLEVAPFGIHVVIVEPGPIRTEFSTTVHKRSDAVTQSPRAAPYEGIIRRTAEARARSRKMSGLGPDAVAATILRAIESKSPATRYPITPLAHVVPTLRNALPDKVFDRILRMTMAK
jgi:NAD(P)-dependent dehydrogenase (short-subunit alcohol dehydrogenase family)